MKYIHFFLFSAVFALFNDIVYADIEWCKSKDKKTKIENMVCEKNSLRKLDEKLNVLYIAAKEIPEIKKTILKTQKNWLSHYRDKCENVKCLRATYKKRIDGLKKSIGKHTDPLEVGSWGYDIKNTTKFTCAGGLEYSGTNALGTVEIEDVKKLRVKYKYSEWACREYSGNYTFLGYTIGNVGYVRGEWGSAILFIYKDHVFFLHYIGSSWIKYQLS